MQNIEFNFEENGKEQFKEIERKFLIHELPENLNCFPCEEIIQGYITISEDGTETCLRKKGDKYYKTTKSGLGKIRTENETGITEEEFNALWSDTEGKRLEKIRYEIPYEDNIIELDIYCGNLEGLVTAEVEFSTEKESDNFVLPFWFGEEVTENKAYKNQKLVSEGIPKDFFS